ncbi:hypothetical protein MHH81_20875 [Psychrobacillus sp. FSL H8-0484]|uniref:hypothetical protein n=1 Tax=Psychrobacillus sp. FSL H8-0484 TaxID=2921390 RepID=UPI0030F8B5EA
MYQISKDNVEEIIGAVLVGYKHANYTKECLSSVKIKRLKAFEQTVDKLIEGIIKLGYCPNAICKPAELIAGIDLGINTFKDLKQSADDDFELTVAKVPVDIGRNYTLSL